MQELIKEMTGYKIVNEDMTCRGVKFEVGKRIELDNDEPLELCKNGFHFCEYPSGVWSYYEKGRVFKVNAYNVLKQEKTPGADYKLVCREIELIEEISITGDLNTGDRNTGDSNTGDSNTGDWNTGDYNTGDYNTGDYNTGDLNTGYSNTGHWNTGDLNTGYSNTGHWNTGDLNTGDGNVGNNHSGHLNSKKAPIYIFDEIVNMKFEDIDFKLIRSLCEKLAKDESFNYEDYLSIPNATIEKIKELHEAHIEGRK